MLNSCNFIGNLVSDPIVIDGDIPKVKFTLAVDRSMKPIDGERMADFLDFVGWRNTAKFMAQYCHKGDLIAVQNATAKKVKSVTKDGEHVSKVVFQADSVDLVRRFAPKEENNPLT